MPPNYLIHFYGGPLDGERLKLFEDWSDVKTYRHTTETRDYVYRIAKVLDYTCTATLEKIGKAKGFHGDL